MRGGELWTRMGQCVGVGGQRERGRERKIGREDSQPFGFSMAVALSDTDPDALVVLQPGNCGEEP